jgi:hypothetical protein
MRIREATRDAELVEVGYGWLDLSALTGQSAEEV